MTAGIESDPHESEERDELASSVLDGEATSTAEKHLRADDDLFQRFSEFAQVAELVGTPVEPLDDLRAHRLIHKALEAGATSTVSGDTLQKNQSRSKTISLIGILGAAAAVLLVVLAVPLLRSNGAVTEGDSQLSAASTYSAADDSSADGQNVDAETVEEMAALPPEWLGAFASNEELADAALVLAQSERQDRGFALGKNDHNTGDEEGPAATHQPFLDTSNHVRPLDECPPLELGLGQSTQGQYQGQVGDLYYNVVVANTATGTPQVYLQALSNCQVIEIVP